MYSMYSKNLTISLPRSNRYVDVAILGGDDNQVFTTMPYKDSDIVFLIPNEKLKMILYSEDGTFLIKSRFREVRKEAESLYCVFDVDVFENILNHRSEKRKNINGKGVFVNGIDINFVDIVDLSLTGMKIETTIPIRDEYITVKYDDNGECISQTGFVKWRRVVKRKCFQYGLCFSEQMNG